MELETSEQLDARRGHRSTLTRLTTRFVKIDAQLGSHDSRRARASASAAGTEGERMRLGFAWVLAALVFAVATTTPSMQGTTAQPRAAVAGAPVPAKLADYKKEAAASVDGM